MPKSARHQWAPESQNVFWLQISVNDLAIEINQRFHDVRCATLWRRGVASAGG